MYHKMQEGTGGRRPYFETRMSPRIFESHLQYLASHGYHTIELGQATDSISASAPSKAVVVTFDDGYRDFYTDAFPLLMQFGFSATVFLITSFVGSHPSGKESSEYMSWNEVREAHARGITFGSHTVTHPDLQQLTAEGIDRELAISKLTIEDELGCKVQSFSYPNAFPRHNRQLIDRMRSALWSFGYDNAATTMIGTATSHCDCFALPRLPINVHDDLHLFEAKLEGAYNWMQYAQSAWKRLIATGRIASRSTHPINRIA